MFKCISIHIINKFGMGRSPFLHQHVDFRGADDVQLAWRALGGVSRCADWSLDFGEPVVLRGSGYLVTGYM